MEKGEHSSQIRQYVPKPEAWEGCVCVPPGMLLAWWPVSSFLGALSLHMGFFLLNKNDLIHRKGQGKQRPPNIRMEAHLLTHSLPSLSLNFIAFIFLFCEKKDTCMLRYTCGWQRTACRSIWVLRIKIRSSGLAVNTFYPLSHLLGPILISS